MTKLRIFDKEKPTAFARAVNFADKVLLLADSLGREERLLSKTLSRRSIKILTHIADMTSQINIEGKRGSLGKVRGNCLKCFAILVLLKERKAIGVMTYASMKADIDGIWAEGKREATGG
jgi:hypothetical protein